MKKYFSWVNSGHFETLLSPIEECQIICQIAVAQHGSLFYIPKRYNLTNVMLCHPVLIPLYFFTLNKTYL